MVVMLIDVWLFEYVIWCWLIMNSWLVISRLGLVDGKCLMKF